MKILGALMLLVLAVLVATTLMIGLGWVLSLLFPLTVFEAAMLVLGTSFLVAFFFGQINRVERIHPMPEWFESEEDDEDAIDEGTKRPVVAPLTVGRNAPCPCGSGKKFKFCCGRTA